MWDWERWESLSGTHTLLSYKDGIHFIDLMISYPSPKISHISFISALRRLSSDPSYLVLLLKSYHPISSRIHNSDLL